MLEQNNENIENEEKIETVKKQRNSIMTSILFLIIFTITCVSVTVFLIYKNTNNINDNNSQNTEQYKKETIAINKKNKKEVEYCEGIKFRDETYDINDISVKEKNISKNEYLVNDKEIEISCLEIDGLKNKKLQDAINARIEKTATDMITKEEIANKNIKEISINAYCEGNFSNVISIRFFKDITYNEKVNDDIYAYEYKYMNVNLVNGEDLKFEELFIKGAPIKNIISHVAYKTLAWEYPADEDEWYSKDMDKKNYADIEEKLFSILEEYNSKENIDFTFSSYQITVYLKNREIYIKMPEFYKYIGIFNRYKEYSNLYDGKYNAPKNVLVFTEYDKEDYNYYNVGKVSDNLFVNIRIRIPDENAPEIILNELNKIEQEIKEKIEEYSNANDGKSRYIYVECQSDYYERDYINEEPVCNIDLTKQIFETDNQYYKDEFYPYVLENNQIREFGAYGGYIQVEEFSKNMKKNVKEIFNSYKTLKYNFDKQQFE